MRPNDTALLPARCVADALLVTEQGRYLMKRRDDFSWLEFRNHWTCFGGGIEPGETPEEALRRELREELAYEVGAAEFFTEIRMIQPFPEPRLEQIAFFTVSIRERDIAGLSLGEGAEMALFYPDDLAKLDNVVPIDLAAVLMHARRDTVFQPKEPVPP